MAESIIISLGGRLRHLGHFGHFNYLPHFNFFDHSGGVGGLGDSSSDGSAITPHVANRFGISKQATKNKGQASLSKQCTICYSTLHLDSSWPDQ